MIIKTPSAPPHLYVTWGVVHHEEEIVATPSEHLTKKVEKPYERTCSRVNYMQVFITIFFVRVSNSPIFFTYHFLSTGFLLLFLWVFFFFLIEGTHCTAAFMWQSGNSIWCQGNRFSCLTWPGDVTEKQIQRPNWNKRKGKCRLNTTNHPAGQRETSCFYSIDTPLPSSISPLFKLNISEKNTIDNSHLTTPFSLAFAGFVVFIK